MRFKTHTKFVTKGDAQVASVTSFALAAKCPKRRKEGGGGAARTKLALAGKTPCIFLASPNSVASDLFVWLRRFKLSFLCFLSFHRQNEYFFVHVSQLSSGV